MSDRNVISICPNCGHEKGKPGQSKYKCKSCGIYICVRKTRFNKTKRPMTVEKYNAIEKEDKENHRKEVAHRHNEAICETLKERIIGIVKSNQHPELNYIQVIDYGSNRRPACDSCQKLVGLYIKISDLPYANVLPNINCNKIPGDYLCDLSYEEVFDDELPPLYKKPAAKQITKRPNTVGRKQKRTLVKMITDWWGK